MLCRTDSPYVRARAPIMHTYLLRGDERALADPHCKLAGRQQGRERERGRKRCQHRAEYHHQRQQEGGAVCVYVCNYQGGLVEDNKPGIVSMASKWPGGMKA